MTLEQLPLIMMRALALTIIIECAAAWILGVRNKQGQRVVLLANCITNPVLVSISAAVMFFSGYMALLVTTLLMEIIVVAVEGIVYKKYLVAYRNPFAIAFICNACSYAAGEVLNRLVF